MGSYRPVSLTSIITKTIKRIVATRLQYYFECNKLISNDQAGLNQFIQQRSCISCLLNSEVHSIHYGGQNLKTYRLYKTNNMFIGSYSF